MLDRIQILKDCTPYWAWTGRWEWKWLSSVSALLITARISEAASKCQWDGDLANLDFVWMTQLYTEWQLGSCIHWPLCGALKVSQDLAIHLNFAFLQIFDRDPASSSCGTTLLSRQDWVWSRQSEYFSFQSHLEWCLFGSIPGKNTLDPLQFENKS